MTQYSMKTKTSGTRVRSNHDVYSGVISSHNAGLVVIGDDVWTALADGAEVRKGDKWLLVSSVDGVPLQVRGWMAIIHKGVEICSNFQEVLNVPPPAPAGIFPASYTMINNETGERALYLFVRKLAPGEIVTG
jgi:hypothetical protein